VRTGGKYRSSGPGWRPPSTERDGGAGDRGSHWDEAEQALVGQAGTPALFEAAGARLDPPADVHGSGAYRREIARVLVERALAEAWRRARVHTIR